MPTCACFANTGPKTRRHLIATLREQAVLPLDAWLLQLLFPRVGSRLFVVLSAVAYRSCACHGGLRSETGVCWRERAVCADSRQCFAFIFCLEGPPYLGYINHRALALRLTPGACSCGRLPISGRQRGAPPPTRHLRFLAGILLMPPLPIPTWR